MRSDLLGEDTRSRLHIAIGIVFSQKDIITTSAWTGKGPTCRSGDVTGLTFGGGLGLGQVRGQQPKNELIQKTGGEFGMHLLALKETFCTK